MKSSNVMMKILAALLWCVVSVGCGADDAPVQKKEIFKNSKPNVKYSTYEKDGKKYASYDFGKAIFTVDRHYLNISDESTIEMRWYWPTLEPILGNATRREKNLKKPIITPETSEVIIRIDFSDGNHYRDGNDSMDYWNKNNCQSEIGQKSDASKKVWCYKEVQSDLDGFKKFIKGKEGESTEYVALPDGPKSPQGRPLVIGCLDKTYLPTNHEPKDLDCGTTFQYYDKISLRILFRGDVVPQWQELTTQIDSFFKSRMQEK